MPTQPYGSHAWNRKHELIAITDENCFGAKMVHHFNLIVTVRNMQVSYTVICVKFYNNCLCM
jgi:hypothetical protein